MLASQSQALKWKESVAAGFLKKVFRVGYPFIFEVPVHGLDRRDMAKALMLMPAAKKDDVNNQQAGPSGVDNSPKPGPSGLKGSSHSNKAHKKEEDDVDPFGDEEMDSVCSQALDDYEEKEKESGNDPNPIKRKGKPLNSQEKSKVLKIVELHTIVIDTAYFWGLNSGLRLGSCHRNK